jgi:hypothetical protein
MSWLSAPRHGLLNTVARRPLRLTVLLLLALVVAGCGRETGAPSLVAPGGANTPIIVTNATPIGCVSPARPAPAGGCIVQDTTTGVSLRVVDAYADVTGTVAQLEETNADNYLLALMTPQLKLASGYVLKGAGGGVTGGPTTVVFDEPLPPQDFAPQVQLVASADIAEPMYSMPPPSPSPTPSWLDKLNGLTLRVPFTLGPARSAAYTYSQPPVVEQGIGVQVQLLDISPGRTAFFGPAGGARVELRFSGLPTNMELLSFIRMEWQRATSDGTSGDHGPGQLGAAYPGHDREHSRDGAAARPTVAGPFVGALG